MQSRLDKVMSVLATAASAFYGPQHSMRAWS